MFNNFRMLSVPFAPFLRNTWFCTSARTLKGLRSTLPLAKFASPTSNHSKQSWGSLLHEEWISVPFPHAVFLYKKSQFVQSHKRVPNTTSFSFKTSPKKLTQVTLRRKWQFVRASSRLLLNTLAAAYRRTHLNALVRKFCLCLLCWNCFSPFFCQGAVSQNEAAVALESKWETLFHLQSDKSLNLFVCLN